MERIRTSAPIVAFLLVWEGGSRVLGDRAALLPPPSVCIHALMQWAREGDLLTDFRSSMVRLLVGLSIGVSCGIVVGLTTGRVRRVSQMVTPLINMWRALPPIALLPIIMLLLGIGDGARVFVIAFGSFFPVWVAAHTGASQIPDQLLWAASTFTRSRRRLFLHVVLPASAPYLVAGVRVAIGSGFTLLFVSELLGASTGLGYRVSISALSYRSDLMLAALFVLGATATVMDWFFRYFVQRALPWLRFMPSSGTPSRDV